MHSSVPLGQKLIAVVVAVATGLGLYAFLSYREAQLALAASLSFDANEAQALDPGIARAPHPAVVLGQSILSDSVVASLAPQAGLGASSTAVAIGEFRTHVELTQPSAGLLSVRYRDPDLSQAAATANAIAKALAAWTPSTAGTAPASDSTPSATTSTPPSTASTPASTSAPASTTSTPPSTTSTPSSTNTAPHPAASAQPAPAPSSSPAPASAAPQQAPAAEPSLAAALGELRAQLSAADQRAGSESSLQSDHDRQRYLESQVRAAQQKLGDLRSQFAHSSSASNAQARLGAIQHALSIFWPSVAGLNTAGTSQAQLRYEREQFTHIIGVVEQEHQAAQREEAANPAPANSAASNSAAASPAPANSAAANPASANSPQPSTPPASQPQPAPAAVAPTPPDSGVNANPLRIESMAGLPAQVVWWPSALIGCFCGLLYWAIAFARHRSSAESDDLLDQSDETAPPPYCFINTAPPAPADSGAEPLGAHPSRTSSRRRASFDPDPDSNSESVPDQSPPPEPTHASATDTVRDIPPETAVAPMQPGSAQSDSVADAVAPVPAPKQQDEVFPRKERDEVPQERFLETADPWGEKIRKNLSQTTIARKLDAPATSEEIGAGKGPARDNGHPPSQPDRRAG